MYKPIVPILEKALCTIESNTMIDLGSGGGGGLLWLNAELRKNNPALKIVLTDYFPNKEAFEYTRKQADNFSYRQESVDARDVPQELNGLRTQFLSFHHFKPADAVRILQNAVDSKSAIAIFEAQERNIPSMIAMFLSPLTVLLSTPFIRPFKINRLLFTYLIPVVPLFVWWDGIVSVLRTYSVTEMQLLVNQVKSSQSFIWEVGKLKSGPGVILYLVGTKA